MPTSPADHGDSGVRRSMPRSSRRSSGPLPDGDALPHRADPDRVAGALADVAGISPFFAVHTGARPGWPSLDRLYRPGPLLAARFAEVHARLGEPEERVTASILFLGMAARLWSPVLASTVVHGIVPDLSPGRTSWQPVGPGPVPLAVVPVGGWDVTGMAPSETAGLLHRAVIDEHLTPLVAALRARRRIAEALLWGNAASALAGTATALRTARPEHAKRCAGLVDELLTRGTLAGTGGYVGSADPADPYRFVRRSCCLYYRIPGGGMCADCALAAPNRTEITRPARTRAARR